MTPRINKLLEHLERELHEIHVDLSYDGLRRLRRQASIVQGDDQDPAPSSDQPQVHHGDEIRFRGDKPKTSKKKMGESDTPGALRVKFSHTGEDGSRATVVRHQSGQHYAVRSDPSGRTQVFKSDSSGNIKKNTSPHWEGPSHDDALAHLNRS